MHQTGISWCLQCRAAGHWPPVIIFSSVTPTSRNYQLIISQGRREGAAMCYGVDLELSFCSLCINWQQYKDFTAALQYKTATHPFPPSPVGSVFLKSAWQCCSVAVLQCCSVVWFVGYKKERKKERVDSSRGRSLALSLTPCVPGRVSQQ